MAVSTNWDIAVNVCLTVVLRAADASSFPAIADPIIDLS